MLLVSNSGGAGDNGGLYGEEGTVTGKKCPEGLYGTFCEVCPLSPPPLTFYNVKEDFARSFQIPKES